MATVIIAKSDYPNGKFGFRGQLQIVLDNPAQKTRRMFSVERSGGLLGEQTVKQPDFTWPQSFLFLLDCRLNVVL